KVPDPQRVEEAHHEADDRVEQRRGRIVLHEAPSPRFAHLPAPSNNEPDRDRGKCEKEQRLGIGHDRDTNLQPNEANTHASRPARRRAGLLGLLSRLWLVGRGGLPPPPVFSGRAGRLQVNAPRIDAAVTVDGRLDEPVWSQAALLTDFSQYAPTDGVAAADST